MISQDRPRKNVDCILVDKKVLCLEDNIVAMRNKDGFGESGDESLLKCKFKELSRSQRTFVFLETTTIPPSSSRELSSEKLL